MKPSQILTLFVVLFVLAYIAHDALGARETPAIAAARDTMRILEVRRDTIRDTIRVRERAKARVDTLVQTVSDTQLVVRETPAAPPETVTVRAPIVARIRTDSALIVSLYADRRVDSLWHVQAAKIPPARQESRWGLGVTAGYGCSDRGCGPQLTAGLTYNAKLPKLRLPFGR